MSDCKGCKYWTQAIDDYANGKHTDKEPNPFCSTCEGDKYQQRGAKETKASMGAKIDAQAAEIEALKAKVAELEADNARMREALEKFTCYPATTPKLQTWEQVAEYYRQGIIKALEGEEG